MFNVTHISHSRPSGDAARIALIACAVALAGMLLFPLATLGRGGSADAVLLHLFGSVMNLSGNQDGIISPSGTVVMLGWATLALLALTLFGAVQRTSWYWMTGLATTLLGIVAVVALNGELNTQVSRILTDSTLRPGAKRQFSNFYASGGMNLGLFLPMLAGLVAAGTGLSARGWWWERFNRMRGLLVPVAAIGLAILLGALVVLVMQPAVNLSGKPLGLWGTWLAKSDLVFYVYSEMFAPVTRLSGVLDSLKLATPLILTGLSVAFAFRTGLFNIGAPGQLTMGAIGAMLVGVYGPPGLGWLLLPLSVLGAALGGALWGAIPGLLKARFGSSEVINTIMLNYIASAIFLFLIGKETFPFLGKEYYLGIKDEGFEPRSKELLENAHLPTLLDLLNVGQGGATALSIGLPVALVAYYVARRFLRANRSGTWIALGLALLLGALTWRVGIPVTLAGSRLNAAFLIALGCVALFGMLMWRTSTGYALRAVGLSPKAAEYGGISVAKNTVLAMTLAGMFAGLAGTHYVNGGALDEYRLKGNMPVNVGFDGIAVALMGQSTPAGVVAASFLFGTIDTGGIEVDRKLDETNKDIVTVLKALIVLFIAAGGFLSRRITNPPPPQLVAAADQAGKPDAGKMSPSVSAAERLTPLPNVAERAEGLSQQASSQDGASRDGDK